MGDDQDVFEVKEMYGPTMKNEKREEVNSRDSLER
jgi:hypothetical protein